VTIIDVANQIPRLAFHHFAIAPSVSGATGASLYFAAACGERHRKQARSKLPNATRSCERPRYR